MGPPSYMRSVVDRNVVMRRIPVFDVLPGLNSQRAQRPQQEPMWISSRNTDYFFLLLFYDSERNEDIDSVQRSRNGVEFRGQCS